MAALVIFAIWFLPVRLFITQVVYQAYVGHDTSAGHSYLVTHTLS